MSEDEKVLQAKNYLINYMLSDNGTKIAKELVNNKNKVLILSLYVKAIDDGKSINCVLGIPDMVVTEIDIIKLKKELNYEVIECDPDTRIDPGK